MKNLEIVSDTLGKLTKIKEGSVFTDSTAFVLELLQNSLRAKALNVYINIDYNNYIVTFEDDGVGCKNPKNVFTLDSSRWSTGINEGFGIGFWSVLAFQTSYITVSSRGWKAEIDVDKIFNDKNLSINFYEVADCVNGFKVQLKCKESSNLEELYECIEENAALQDYNVYINGDYLEKKNIYEGIIDDCKYYEFFNTNLFEGVLGIAELDTEVDIYYEGRFVCSKHFDGIAGTLKMKKGALTYKEPDRRSIIYDKKLWRFMEKVEQLAAKLYKYSLPKMTMSELDTYSSGISNYLNVREYAKLLPLDDVVIGLSAKNKLDDSKNYYSLSNDKTNKNEEVSETVEILSEKGENESTTDNIKNSNFYNDNDTEIIEENKRVIDKEESDFDTLNNNCYKEELNSNTIDKSQENYIAPNLDEETVKDEDIVRINNICDFGKTEKKEVKKVSNKQNLLSILKKHKQTFWCYSNDIDVYSDEISKATYYGFTVYKAPNSLYAETYKSKGIMYISEINSVFQRKSLVLNIEIKNKTEKRKLELLERIRNYYNLPEGFFRIADLGSEIIFKNGDEILCKKQEKNSVKKITVLGCTDFDNIYLDRRYVKSKKFTFTKSNKLSSGEYRYLMFILPTVAHELAHFLYKTEDNTTKHFKLENEILEVITSLYI